MVGSFRKQGDWGTHLEGTRRRTQAVTHALDLRSEPSKPIGSVCCASARTASPSFTIRRTRSVRGTPGGSRLWSRYGGTNGRQTGRPRLDERPEWGRSGRARVHAATPRRAARQDPVPVLRDRFGNWTAAASRRRSEDVRRQDRDDLAVAPALCAKTQRPRSARGARRR